MALDESFRVNNDLIVASDIYANTAAASAYFTTTNASTQILSAGTDLLDIFITTIANSANWDSVYTTVLSNSADWVTYSSTDISSAGWVIDEDTLATDSATRVPTQQSVKAYVDTIITGINNIKGGYDASTDTPAITAGSGVLQGDTYYVTASGVFYSQSVDNGDLIIATVDNANSITDWVIVNRNLQDELIDRWNSTYSTMSANSANWDSTYTTVQTNSASWDDGITSLPNSSNWDSTYTTVQTNSSSWNIGGSGGTGGGGSGAFVTDVTCSGITTKTNDTDQVAVSDGSGGTYVPVLSAEVDDPVVTFTVQWEGLVDQWTGFPTVSGTSITKSNTTSLGTNVRRFEGDISLDLTSYAGTTVNVPYEYNGDTKNIAVTVAGAGPEVVGVVVSGNEPFSQDHYKDGDTIELTVEFNTSDVSKVTLDASGTATIGQVINVNTSGTNFATFTTTIDTAVTSRTNLPIKITAQNAFGTQGTQFTSGNIVDCLAGPVVESVSFGSLPGTQTELKSGDTILATFTFDTTNVDRVNLDGTNDNNLASSDQTINVTTTGKNADATITINYTLGANTGGVNGTGGQNKPIKARAKKNNHHGNWGGFLTSSATLTVNNQAPTFSSPSVTYPASQTAIASGDSATVNIVVSNQGATVGAASYSYTSPGNQLTITSPAVYDVSGDKDVSVNSGFTSSNTSTNNYTLTVVRPENGKSSSVSTLVKIVTTTPSLTVSYTGARLRSGGNAGTSVQQYGITLTSTEPLADFSMDPATSAGTFASTTWQTTNNTVWTNTLNVSDNDNKGTFSWQNVDAATQANVSKTSINTGATYVLGGFVSRTLTPSAQSRTVAIGTNVSNTSKLTATETFRGTITFDSSIADGVTIDPDITTGVDVASKFTIVSASSPNVVDYDGDTFFYLDRAAVANNASGTSTINITENI